jgi:tetratricopeptide (TPR) repeat protein
MNSTPYRAASRTKTAGRLALALALAGGMALGSAVATPAFAKDKQEAKVESNSKAFAEAYAPMQKIINAGGDFASAKAMIPTVQAAIQTPADKNTFGMALINLGGKLNDVALQKQGIQLALDSGIAPPAQVGLFHYYLGQWAFADKNYAEARTQLQAALQAGHTDGDAEAMIAETYFGQQQGAQGLQVLSNLIQKRAAAGQQVPENWYRRGLKVAYESKLGPQAADFATMLVSKYPSPDNWQGALQVVNAVGQLDDASKLDLFRLMRETGGLKDQHDYLAYAFDADPMKLSHEVVDVLDEGVKAGVLNASNNDVKQLKATANSRMAANQAVAAELAADARKSPTAKLAIVAGDQFYSQGSYDKAAEMYRLAADKGGDDGNLARERLGIAQVKQGQLDAAKATFAQVTGNRAAVARMWQAYIASRSGVPTPPTPPAPPAPPARGA